MIAGFADKETERIWNGDVSLRLPIHIQMVARRKLRMLHAAQYLDDLRIPPANRLEMLRGRVRVNTVFASMINGVSASFGGTAFALKSKLSTITKFLRT